MEETGLHITFAAPGSSNISSMTPIGDVSPLQLFTVAKYLELVANQAIQVQLLEQAKTDNLVLKVS